MFRLTLAGSLPFIVTGFCKIRNVPRNDQVVVLQRTKRRTNLFRRSRLRSARPSTNLLEISTAVRGSRDSRSDSAASASFRLLHAMVNLGRERRRIMRAARIGNPDAACFSWQLRIANYYSSAITTEYIHYILIN